MASVAAENCVEIDCTVLGCADGEKRSRFDWMVSDMMDQIYIRVHYAEAECEDDVIACKPKVDVNRECIAKLRSFVNLKADEINKCYELDYFSRSDKLINALSKEFDDAFSFEFVSATCWVTLYG